MGMEDPAWWPSGIAQQSMEEALADGQLRTALGRVQLWNYADALDTAWWHSPPGNGVQWGKWPTDVVRIEPSTEDTYGLTLLLNEDYVVRICPLLVGEDVSRMARYEPWNTSVSALNLLLPIGGWTAGGHDRVLIYSRYDRAPFEPDSEQVHSLVASMAQVHTALEPHATPNTERLWNERLKAMEDVLKPHTLWRAPHTTSTVGLPPIELNVEHLATSEKGPMWIALPRSLHDHLVCKPERLPSPVGAPCRIGGESPTRTSRSLGSACSAFLVQRKSPLNRNGRAVGVALQRCARTLVVGSNVWRQALGRGVPRLAWRSVSTPSASGHLAHVEGRSLGCTHRASRGLFRP